MSIRTNRLKSMRDELQRALAAPDDDRIQRAALNNIIRESYYAGEPPIDWLAREFGYERKAAPAFVCAGCGAGFDNQVALSGHGPARCQKKNVSRQNLIAV